MIGVTKDGDEVISCLGQCSNTVKIPDMTLRPVYTQEMGDAGMLPPVGSLFNLRGWSRVCEMTAIGRDMCIFLFGDVEYTREISLCAFIPISSKTPKQNFIETAARIMFDVEGGDHQINDVTLGVLFDSELIKNKGGCFE